MTNFQKLNQLTDLRGKTTHNGSYTDYGVNSKTHIIIHHSLTTSGNSQAFANFHVNTHGWPAVAYHFVILKDGTIEWNHNLGVKSYHVGNHNKYSVGICLVGDFRTEKPTQAQIKSMYELSVALKKDMPNYKTTVGHSDLAGYEWKQCPVFDYKKALLDYHLKLVEEDKMNKQREAVSEWARSSYDFVMKHGISDGKAPQGQVTREEVWTMLKRFHDKFIK